MKQNQSVADFVIHRLDKNMKYPLVFQQQDGWMYLLLLLPHLTIQGLQS